MRPLPYVLALALTAYAPWLLAQSGGTSASGGTSPSGPSTGSSPAVSGTPTAPSSPAESVAAPPMPDAPTGSPGGPVAGTVPASAPTTGFSFGSYGRVSIASDLRGHTGRPANVVAFGPRIDLPSYAEIQFNYDARLRDIRVRTVVTLAFDENLFHFTGNFNGTVAVRNLYLEERGALLDDLTLWVGSRMYRGDDIYLLNFWALDNLNTVGGGAFYDLGSHATLAAHVGMNRLDDPYQLQSITVAPRAGFGPVTALLLDRPRIIGSAKATYWLSGRTAHEGMKFSLYGEYHAMAAGVRQTTDAGGREELPSDTGYVMGAQAGIYQGPSFLNVFVRYAQGLGAYGELAVPVLANGVTSSQRAEEFRLAFSGNYEGGWWGLMGGGYVRYFRDADPGVYSRGSLWEACIDLRPMVYVGQHAGLAVEGSYQTVAYDSLDPVTGEATRGSLWRFAVMPFVSPFGRGSYTRPQIQVVYAATLRDAGAQRLYAPGDPFGLNSVEHYLGIGTEWWFNSSYL